MKFINILFISVILLLSSCSLLSTLAVDAADKISITWDQPDNAKPIDSIRIHTRYYWIENIDTIYQNTDYEVGRAALSSWFLETDSLRRNEIIFDSTIYIYPKQ